MSKESTQFKPGQSGNPKGGPKSTITQKELRQKDKEFINEIFREVLKTPYWALAEKQKKVAEQLEIFKRSGVTPEDNISCLEMAATNYAIKGVNGSTIHLGFVINRLIGKAAQNLILQGDDENPIIPNINIQSESISNTINEAIEKIQKEISLPNEKRIYPSKPE